MMPDTETDALKKRVAALEEALKPFADLWAGLQLQSGNDDSNCEVYVRQGDLRRAFSAMTSGAGK